MIRKPAHAILRSLFPILVLTFLPVPAPAQTAPAQTATPSDVPPIVKQDVVAAPVYLFSREADRVEGPNVDLVAYDQYQSSGRLFGRRWRRAASPEPSASHNTPVHSRDRTPLPAVPQPIPDDDLLSVSRNVDRDRPRDEPAVDEDPGADDTSSSVEPLSPEMVALRKRIRYCLAHYFHRPENVAARSPWGIMHAMLPYGVDAEVVVNGEKMNAIGWLCWNGSCRGQRLFEARQGDKFVVQVGPGFQGHEGQLLAMLAQSRVREQYTIKVGDRQLTVKDLVRYEMAGCRDATELTFKLIGLSHYLESDASWVNDVGETWDLPRLIREELKQPVIGAACGGTHRMMGFSYALRVREKEGRPLDGQWARARQYVDDYIEYALRLRNQDGSFSTRWFEGRGAEPDIERRLQTTGHILEWLVFSLPDDQLDRPEVVGSVNYLVNLMLKERGHDWEIGPRGHALRALALYDQRVFGGKLGDREEEFARLLRSAARRRR